MPELPEVETIRRDLQAVLPGKQIAAVQVKKPKVVHGSIPALKKALIGQRIKKIERRAKLLIVSFTKQPDLFVLIHLKMTGQLIFKSPKYLIAGGHSWPNLNKDELPGKHSHIIVTFKDKSELYFNDLRQFGYFRLATADQKERIVASYGIEPGLPDFTRANFRKALAGRQAPLKNVLLDQTTIAGLGNIYVDEACLLAGIRPQRRTHTLTEAEVKKLYQSIQKVIKLAIKERGTTFNHYRDAQGKKGNFVKFLKAYGRAGATCLICKKTTLEKTKVAGRGTVYCPHCQK